MYNICIDNFNYIFLLNLVIRLYNFFFDLFGLGLLVSFEGLFDVNILFFIYYFVIKRKKLFCY